MIPVVALALYLICLGAYEIGRIAQAESYARQRERHEASMAALRAQVVKPSSIDVVV